MFPLVPSNFKMYFATGRIAFTTFFDILDMGPWLKWELTVGYLSIYMSVICNKI